MVARGDRSELSLSDVPKWSCSDRATLSKLEPDRMPELTVNTLSAVTRTLRQTAVELAYR